MPVRHLSLRLSGLALYTLVILASRTAWATDVAGDCPAGGFTAAGSPWNFTSTVSVPAATTCTVQAGATLTGNGNALSVYGTLNAVGTSSANRDAVFDNVQINIQPGSTATLQHCTLNLSPYYSFYSPPFILQDSATVTECTITSTAYYAVYVASGTPTITGNTITGGVLSLYYGAGGGTASGNTIGNTSNPGTSIYVADAATPVLDGNIILDNPVGGTGISVAGSGVQVTNNTLYASGGDIPLQLNPTNFASVSGNSFPTGLGAGISLSGTVSGTVTIGTFAPGPGTVVNTYTVQSLGVPAGATLIVAPGSTLTSQYYYGGSLNVSGTLQAVGTSTANRDVEFDNVQISVASGGSATLQYCAMNWTTGYYGYYPISLQDSATVTQCTITGGYYGISVENGTPTISGNTITASSIGLSYSAASGGTASGNTISAATGIAVADGATPVLDGNTILDNPGTGISVGGSGVQVTNNTVYASGNTFPLQLNPTDFALVSGNHFPTGLAAGIALNGTVSGTVTIGTLTPGPGTVVNTYTLQGLSVPAAATLTIAPGITLTGSYPYGSLSVYGTLQAVGTSSASRDVVLNNVQITIAPGGSATVQYCTVNYSPNYYYSYSPLRLQDSAIVTSCTITSSSYYAVDVTGGTPTISGNTITTASWGLYYEGGGGTASGNIIGFSGAGSGRIGIYVAAGATPVLDDNTIQDDPAQNDTGITVLGSGVQVSNNTVYASGGDIALQLNPTDFASVSGNHFPTGLAAGVLLNGTVAGTTTIGTLAPGPGTAVNTYTVSSLYVPYGATLTLAAGTTLTGNSPQSGGSLGVDGTLQAVGTNSASRDVVFDNVGVSVGSGGAATLQYCTLTWTVNSSQPIYLQGSASVLSCTISSYYYSIYVTSGAATISGNTIGFNGGGSGRTAIYIADGATPVLDGNTILDDPAQNDTGIAVLGGGVQVSNNTVYASGGDVPLQLNPMDFALVSGNHFPTGLAAGIQLIGTVAGTATIGTLTAGPGTVVNAFAVQYLYVYAPATLTIAPGITLTGSDPQSGGYLGVYGGTLQAVGTSSASRNVVLDNVQIYVDYAGTATLQYCTLRTAYYAAYSLHLRNSASVIGCSISSSTSAGYPTIYVEYGTPTISGNTITTGGVGLEYAGSGGGTASGNSIGFVPGGNGRIGILVYNSAAPVIDSNVILDDVAATDTGVSLNVSDGNAVQVTNNTLCASGADVGIYIANGFTPAPGQISGNTTACGGLPTGTPTNTPTITGPPTITPTITPTKPTATPTRTPSITPTFPPTWTPTATATRTATSKTPTPTASPTATGIVVTVKDTTQAAISGADVVVIDSDGNKFSAVSGSDGMASLAGLPDGEYTLYAWAPGYMPETLQVTQAAGTGAALVTLRSGDLAMTNLDSRRLTTYDEILAAGIDPTDPNNQNVFQFQINLFFDESSLSASLTGYIGSSGSSGGGADIGSHFILPAPVGGGGSCTADMCVFSAGAGGGGGGGGGGGSTAVGIPQVVEGQPSIFWLVIPGKASWLKEFFSIRTVVTNLASAPFSFTNGTATLELPSGLSLAPTLNPQSLSVAMADIPGHSSGAAEWVIRGDVAGDYDLSTSYAGVLFPFGRVVNFTAQTPHPLKVWGGSALEMIVDADDQAYKFYPYRLRIGLHNVTGTVPAEATDVFNPAVQLLDAGRENFIWQPRQQMSFETAVIHPGDTFWTDAIIIVPSVNNNGYLDLSASFVAKTAGNVDVPSQIVPVTPIQNPSTAPTLQFAGPGLLTWQAVPGTEKYQLFKTLAAAGVDPFPTEDFPSAPIAETTSTSASDTGADSCSAWYGLSTVTGGKNVMFHPILFRAGNCPTVDAAVLVPKPLSVTIPTTKTEVAKTLMVTVRNADTADRVISLTVDASDCPAGVAGLPDFVAGTPTVADTSILVPAGKTKTARLPLTIRSADFRSFNFKAPARCTLKLTAAAVVAGGSIDPNPANNVASVELSVVDKHDPEQTAQHETTVKSAAPKVMTVSASNTTKTLKVTVGNADYRPSPEKPGDAITLAATSSCAALSLSPPVCDTRTSSPTVTLRGGTTKTCKITATADRAQISTPNKLSPQRCSVSLTATGPTGHESAPLDASNNTTKLLVDVLDQGDF